MSVSVKIQKAATYIRAVQEAALYVTMVNSRWYIAFRASPLFFVMLPFIGFLLTVNALMNGYHLAKANNKNLDQWLGFIVSVLCAVLASVSLYGAALTTFMELSFAAGPWFFFSSLTAATLHQLFSVGLNFYRSYESLPGSAQRMHYLQAAFNNLFNLALLSAAFGAVIFVMLFPAVAPVVGAVSAIIAVSFTVFDIMWRMAPHNWKLSIKKFLGLGKPELVQNNSLEPTQDVVFKEDAGKAFKENPNHHRLFTCFDYSAEVRKMDLTRAKSYLNQIITNKIQFLNGLVLDQKIGNKLSVLNELNNAMNNSSTVSKKNLLKNFPLAFQSFWAEKGDIEQIFDAVLVLQEKLEAIPVDNLIISV